MVAVQAGLPRDGRPFVRSTSESSVLVPQVPLGGPTAAEVVRRILPGCAPTMLNRLSRERVVTAQDLAGLDKKDLRELGFSMLQRSRLLLWAHQPEANCPGSKEALPQHTSAKSPEGVTKAVTRKEEALDKIEEQADFWCSIVLSAKQVDYEGPASVEDDCDVRENVLEELYDLSAERVLQLYEGMSSAQPGGEVSLDALRQALRRCGLPEFDDGTLTRVLQAVNPRAQGCLEVAEFEAILSRLKLAQLLAGACRLPLGGDSLSGRLRLGSSVNVSIAAISKRVDFFTATDYSLHKATTRRVSKAHFREFFFGHRQRQEGPLPPVRWVHVAGLDLPLLLALTVKYNLHPLGVEDVIEQCPTKIDRYGGHYFAAVEQLCLVSAADGSEPVRVHGRHVSIFCSGPPLVDTIVTITAPDHDEKEDWPGGPVRDAGGTGDAWVERLLQRLDASHSRLRERRADFMMYQILDLSSDEFVKIANAYAKRLIRLEGRQLVTPSDDMMVERLGEVTLAQRQLGVVLRRLRGLQRVVRHVLADPDLPPGLTGYVADIRDHIDEAYEDTVFLVDKCRAINEASERAHDRDQENCRQRREEKLNVMIFILTAATAIMAPMHFLSMVYGMNFKNAKGTPTMPELLLSHGYAGFWVFILSYIVSGIACSWLLFLRFQRKVNEDYCRAGGKDSSLPGRLEGVAAGPLVAGDSSSIASSSVRTPLLPHRWVDRAGRLSPGWLGRLAAGRAAGSSGGGGRPR